MLLDGAKFICMDGSENPVETIVAKGKNFTIGSSLDCDYIIEQAEKVHCRIECDAFGHVTIYNKSEKTPISVNDEIVTIKRNLFNKSKIKILNKDFVWHHATHVEATFSADGMSTPSKQIGIPVQPPNSCPSLKNHRNISNRFTVHNLKSYRVDSEESNCEASASTETRLESTNQKIFEEPLLDVTPAKVDLVDSTPDKKTSSTEKRLKTFRNVWGWSGMTTTSYSPREAGVRIEKSFTAIIPPTTPNSSLCRTPRGLLERLGIEKQSNNASNTDLLVYATPLKQSENKPSNPQGVVVQHKKSAMKILDLTTPSKLRPESPHPKTLSIKKPCAVKSLGSFSERSVASSNRTNTLTTPMLNTPKTGADIETPISTSSAITVDSSSAASDTFEASVVTSTTPSRPPKAAQATTPGSILRKQALMASVKKQHQTTATTPVSTKLKTTSSTVGGTQTITSDRNLSTKKNPAIVQLNIADSSFNKTNKLQISKIYENPAANINQVANNLLTTSTPYKAVSMGDKNNKPDSTQLQDTTEFFSALRSSSDDETEEIIEDATAQTDEKQTPLRAVDGGSGDELLQEIEEILNTSDELKRQIQATADDENDELADNANNLLVTVSPPPASIELIEPIIPPASITLNVDNKKSTKSSVIASVLLTAIDNAEKQKSLSPKEDDEKENEINKSSVTPPAGSTARRRISLSTPISISVTPATPTVALIAEEINSSSIAATPLTPKRVTKRRPSIDEVPLGKMPHNKTIDHFNTENMGAIVEEEPTADEVSQAVNTNITNANQIDRDYITLDASAVMTASMTTTESTCLAEDPKQTLTKNNPDIDDEVVMSPLQCLDESFAEPCDAQHKVETQDNIIDDKTLNNIPDENPENWAVIKEAATRTPNAQSEFTKNVEIQILDEKRNESTQQLDESFGEVEYLEDSDVMKETDEDGHIERQTTNLTFEIEASKTTIETVDNELLPKDVSVIDILSDDDEEVLVRSESVKTKTIDVVEKANTVERLSDTSSKVDFNKTVNPNKTIEICEVDLNTLDISAVLPLNKNLSAKPNEFVDLTLSDSQDPLLMEINKPMGANYMLEKTTEIKTIQKEDSVNKSLNESEGFEKLSCLNTEASKLKLDKHKEISVEEQALESSDVCQLINSEKTIDVKTVAIDTPSNQAETESAKNSALKESDKSVFDESNLVESDKTSEIDEIEVNQSLISKIEEAEAQQHKTDNRQKDPLSMSATGNESLDVSQTLNGENLNKSLLDKQAEDDTNSRSDTALEAGTKSFLEVTEATSITKSIGEPKDASIKSSVTLTDVNETFSSGMEVSQMLLVDESPITHIAKNAEIYANKNTIELVNQQPTSLSENAVDNVKLNEKAAENTAEIKIADVTCEETLENETTKASDEKLALLSKTEVSESQLSPVCDLIEEKAQSSVIAEAVESRQSVNLFEAETLALDNESEKNQTSDESNYDRGNDFGSNQRTETHQEEQSATVSATDVSKKVESEESIVEDNATHFAQDVPVIVLDDTLDLEAGESAQDIQNESSKSSEATPVITLNDTGELKDENKIQEQQQESRTVETIMDSTKKEVIKPNAELDMPTVDAMKAVETHTNKETEMSKLENNASKYVCVETLLSSEDKESEETSAEKNIYNTNVQENKVQKTIEVQAEKKASPKNEQTEVSTAATNASIASSESRASLDESNEEFESHETLQKAVTSRKCKASFAAERSEEIALSEEEDNRFSEDESKEDVIIESDGEEESLRETTEDKVENLIRQEKVLNQSKESALSVDSSDDDGEEKTIECSKHVVTVEDRVEDNSKSFDIKVVELNELNKKDVNESKSFDNSASNDESNQQKEELTEATKLNEKLSTQSEIGDLKAEENVTKVNANDDAQVQVSQDFTENMKEAEAIQSTVATESDELFAESNSDKTSLLKANSKQQRVAIVSETAISENMSKTEASCENIADNQSDEKDNSLDKRHFNVIEVEEEELKEERKSAVEQITQDSLEKNNLESDDQKTAEKNQLFEVKPEDGLLEEMSVIDEEEQSCSLEGDKTDNMNAANNSKEELKEQEQSFKTESEKQTLEKTSINEEKKQNYSHEDKTYSMEKESKMLVEKEKSFDSTEPKESEKCGAPEESHVEINSTRKEKLEVEPITYVGQAVQSEDTEKTSDSETAAEESLLLQEKPAEEPLEDNSRAKLDFQDPETAEKITELKISSYEDIEQTEGLEGDPAELLEKSISEKNTSKESLIDEGIMTNEVFLLQSVHKKEEPQTPENENTNDIITVVTSEPSIEERMLLKEPQAEQIESEPEEVQQQPFVKDIVEDVSDANTILLHKEQEEKTIEEITPNTAAKDTQALEDGQEEKRKQSFEEQVEDHAESTKLPEEESNETPDEANVSETCEEGTVGPIKELEVELFKPIEGFTATTKASEKIQVVALLTDDGLENVSPNETSIEEHNAQTGVSESTNALQDEQQTIELPQKEESLKLEEPVLPVSEEIFSTKPTEPNDIAPETFIEPPVTSIKKGIAQTMPSESTKTLEKEQQIEEAVYEENSTTKLSEKDITQIVSSESLEALKVNQKTEELSQKDESLKPEEPILVVSEEIFPTKPSEPNDEAPESATKSHETSTEKDITQTVSAENTEEGQQTDKMSQKEEGISTTKPSEPNERAPESAAKPDKISIEKDITQTVSSESTKEDTDKVSPREESLKLDDSVLTVSEESSNPSQLNDKAPESDTKQQTNKTKSKLGNKSKKTKNQDVEDKSFTINEEAFEEKDEKKIEVDIVKQVETVGLESEKQKEQTPANHRGALRRRAAAVAPKYDETSDTELDRHKPNRKRRAVGSQKNSPKKNRASLEVAQDDVAVKEVKTPASKRGHKKKLELEEQQAVGPADEATIAAKEATTPKKRVRKNTKQEKTSTATDDTMSKAEPESVETQNVSNLKETAPTQKTQRGRGAHKVEKVEETEPEELKQENVENESATPAKKTQARRARTPKTKAEPAVEEDLKGEEKEEMVKARKTTERKPRAGKRTVVSESIPKTETEATEEPAPIPPKRNRRLNSQIEKSENVVSQEKFEPTVSSVNTSSGTGNIKKSRGRHAKHAAEDLSGTITEEPVQQPQVQEAEHNDREEFKPTKSRGESTRRGKNQVVATTEDLDAANAVADIIEAQIKPKTARGGRRVGRGVKNVDVEIAESTQSVQESAYDEGGKSIAVAETTTKARGRGRAKKHETLTETTIETEAPSEATKTETKQRAATGSGGGRRVGAKKGANVAETSTEETIKTNVTAFEEEDEKEISMTKEVKHNKGRAVGRRAKPAEVLEDISTTALVATAGSKRAAAKRAQSKIAEQQLNADDNNDRHYEDKTDSIPEVKTKTSRKRNASTKQKHESESIDFEMSDEQTVTETAPKKTTRGRRGAQKQIQLQSEPAAEPVEDILTSNSSTSKSTNNRSRHVHFNEASNTITPIDDVPLDETTKTAENVVSSAVATAPPKRRRRN